MRYEVDRNELYDCIIMVKKDLVPTFLERVGEKEEWLKDDLEKNSPTYEHIDDSYNPYQNMAFDKDGYKIWIRRNLSRDNTFEICEEVAGEMEVDFEDEQDNIVGLKVFQETNWDTMSFIGDDIVRALLKLNFAITYDLILDDGDEDCEQLLDQEHNFVNLPPAVNPKNFNKTFAKRNLELKWETPYPEGILFATFVFSMSSDVVKELKEQIPKDMLEYLEKMNTTHAIYHGDNDEDMDGCEAYVLPNVPVLCFDKEGNVHQDDDLMGVRLIKFLDENSDDLKDFGSFSICMAPQPNILSYSDRSFYDHFTTPLSIIDNISNCTPSGYDWDDVSYMWGDPLYYMEDPFHMQIQRYIYVDALPGGGCEFKADENPSFWQNDLEKVDENSSDHGEKGDKDVPSHSKNKDIANNASLKDGFRKYLIAHGYKEYTDKGAPSTVYDYMKRIDFIAREENTDWAGVAANVDRLVEEYGRGGAKEELGMTSHDAVINALKAFQRFIKGDHQEKESPEINEAGSESPANTPAGLLVDSAEAITTDITNNTSLKDGFRKYLIAHGYKEYTDKGAPSTVYDYIKRIDCIAREENTDWAGVAANVDRLVEEYDKGGAKEELGTTSHDAVINALKAFQRFIKDGRQEKESPEVKEARSESPAKTPAELLVDPAEAITDDYIQCCICGEKRASLTSKHLAEHGLSVEEYKNLCGYDPDQPLMSLNRFEHSRILIEAAKKRRE